MAGGQAGPSLVRFTKQAGTEGRKVAEVSAPLSEELRAELGALFDKHMAADVLESLEDELEKIFRSLPQERRGVPLAFTRGLYLTLLMALTRLEVRQNAVAEFQMLRRRDLEKRIADLEARPSFRYRGVFDKDETYSGGDFVTYSGGMWHANIQTKGVVPGDGNSCFTLAVKRGRNGRDRDQKEAP